MGEFNTDSQFLGTDVARLLIAVLICSVNTVILVFVGNHAPRIKFLSLNCDVSTSVLDEIGARFPHLVGVNLGEFNTDSQFLGADVARLLIACKDIEVLVVLCRRCTVNDICIHAPQRVKELKALVTPYSYVKDPSIRLLYDADALRNKIELNFGCDYTTIDGLTIVFNNAHNLQALSFTSVSPRDFTQAMRTLCDPDVLPELKVLGIRARDGVDPQVLVDFRRRRPQCMLYNYRVRLFSSQWCFNVFSFTDVCRRTGALSF